MRSLHKLYAKANGYFWLPCPKCGDMFGGHEIGRTSIPTERPGISLVCCKKHDSDEEIDGTIYQIKPSR